MGCGASHPPAAGKAAGKEPPPAPKPGELVLEEQGLTEITTEFSPDLKLVNVSKNSLKALPAALTSLSELLILDASANELTGLPTGISACTLLEELHLYKNEIKDFPTEIATLQQLKLLNLFNNKLRKIPDELGQLANLVEVNVAANKLMMISDAAFTNWSSVKILNLYDNNLVRLGSLAPLVCLHELRLYGNNLEDMPTLGPAKELEVLEVQKNRISKIEDNYFEQLPALKRLVASDNQLTSFASSILKCSLLEQLQIQNNKLLSLPGGAPWPTSLLTLFVQDNTSITHLPKELTGCSSLRRCNLTNLPLGNEASVTAEELKSICTSKKGGVFWDEHGIKAAG
ncbi:hypothetical protein AB1Y20_007019 [Prymnesium parvum]|uniref:Uncharacterized protein n=1 Tax=Prymnesium parvum TaxID=97485 RepID=A0AB34J299_PRYPA